MARLIKIFLFLVIPFLVLMIISASLRDDKSIQQYVVTNLTGKAFIRYEKKYNTTTKTDQIEEKLYEGQSNWIPLSLDMKINTDVTIRTEKGSSVDLLLDQGMAVKIKEDSLIKLDEKMKKGNISSKVRNVQIFLFWKRCV